MIDVVSFDRVDAIVNGSFASSFARSCEVSLESWGTRVKDGDHICVVGPCFSEDLFELVRESLEGLSLGLR